MLPGASGFSRSKAGNGETAVENGVSGNDRDDVNVLKNTIWDSPDSGVGVL